VDEKEVKALQGIVREEVRGEVRHGEIHKIRFEMLRDRVAAAAVVAVLAAAVAIQAVSGRGAMARQLRELTQVRDGFDIRDAGPQERKEKFRKLALRIFAVYGKAYRAGSPEAFSMEQKREVIDLWLNAADAVNLDPWVVPTLGILETALNPNGMGEYGEIGYLQIKMDAARWAERVLQLMPERFKDLLQFSIQDERSLLDPITSTKAAFCLLYALRSEFNGREEWWVSVYHWGGFLRRYWDRGAGDIPRKFHLSGVEYDVITYYYAYKQLKDCFDKGEIEVGRPTADDWRARAAKLIAEERSLLDAKRVIMGLRARAEERDREIEDLRKLNEGLTDTLRKAEKDLERIYGLAREGRAAEVRRRLSEAKGVVLELLKKIRKEEENRFVALMAGIAAAAIALVALVAVGATSTARAARRAAGRLLARLKKKAK
jgi:hypothetical protein